MRVTVGGIEAQLGNKGIVLHIADNSGRHVGKLRVGQATIEWCKGRTRIGNGRKLKLIRVIDQILERAEPGR